MRSPFLRSLLLASLTLGLGIVAAAPCGAAAGDTGSAQAPLRTVPLGKGDVAVYATGPLTLHAYRTGDPLADVCFALETADNLVAIEGPAFAADITAWQGYLQGLGKPLTDVLIASHPAGGRWFGKATSHATPQAIKAIESGSTRAITDNLGAAFGKDFDTTRTPIDHELQPGANTIGGIAMEILPAGDSYDIAIPAASLVYTHMLGADTHSILAGQEHMTAFLEQLDAMRRAGYALILSSHHTPEGQAELAAKMAYVEDVRVMAGESRDRADFVARVRAKYPDLAGTNYLDMTAGFLFAE